MRSVAPEEYHVFLFAIDDLTGIVAQGRGGIPYRFFCFIGGVTSRIFEVVFFGGGHDGF